MKHKKSPPAPAEIRRELSGLWPALKGSLAQVKKPCIRPACRRCASGQKHPAWLLSFTRGSKRRCMYVPLALAPLLKQAIKNGRRIESLLYRMGAALIEEHRAKQRGGKTEKTNLKSSRSRDHKKNPKPKS